MKEEALKLADDLQGLCEYSYVEIPDYQAMQYVDMIRKLVAENDNLFKALIAEQETKPLNYEELGRLAEQAEKESFGMVRLKPDGGISMHPMLEVFAKLIEERHGIK